MSNSNCKVSSVTKKLLTGITGLALVGFLVVHLIGNLTLYAGAEVFNAYAHFLHHFMHGAFIYIAEAGLLAFFVVHIWMAFSVQLSKKKARPQGYAVNANAGGQSKKTRSSTTMAISGLILLAFVIVHLNHFKFGVEKEIFIMSDGSQVQNAYKMAVEGFQGQWGYVAFYVLAMAVLCSHLMHGLWSAVQSLGWTRAKNIPVIYTAGVVIAIALALGFMLLPILIAACPECFDPNATAAPHDGHVLLSTFPLNLG